MPPAPQSLTRQEARQRAGVISQVSYAIELDLSRGAERFGSDTKIEFSAEAGQDSFVEADLEQILGVELNGERLPGKGPRIELPRLAARNSLRVLAEGRFDRTELGLHLSHDPADGLTYIYTDLEPYEAHRVFACFDQPDLKAPISLRVRAPREWLVVSAEPGVAGPVDPADDARWWSFPATMPLSPYVLGIAAGSFQEVRSESQGISLGLYCARSLVPHLDAEELFALTGAGLDYYQRAFGIPYPFSKYDQVFCPEKVNGAMESPGCITITDTMLFRGRPTSTHLSLRVDYVLHEMAHMWFGDLVTMRWWDDLWLNESFASIMAVLAAEATTEFHDAWLTQVLVAEPRARAQDQRPTSHPVAAEIESTSDVRTKFDRITYDKGAAALRQLVAWVGEERFLAGIHDYLVEHRQGNADFGDLVRALEAASGRDVSSWAEAWLHTSGVDTLTLEPADRDADPPSSVAVVKRASGATPRPRPHRLRLGVFEWSGERLERSSSPEFDLEQERTALELPRGSDRAPLLLLNDGDLTYAKVRLDERSMETAHGHLSAVPEALARGLIWDASWDMVQDAELAPGPFVEMVVRHLPEETEPALVSGVMSFARSAIRRYGDPARAEAREVELAQMAESTLAGQAEGDDLQLIWLRLLISVLTTPEQLRRGRTWLRGEGLPRGIELDSELRWTLVQSLAARGAADEEEIQGALAADLSSSGQTLAQVARAARPSEAAKAAAWARFLDPSCTLVEAYRSGASFAGVRQEELVRPYAARLPELLEQILAERGHPFATEFWSWLPFSLPPSPELARSCRRELERGDLHPDLRRVLENVAEDAERMLRARQLDRRTEGLPAQPVR